MVNRGFPRARPYGFDLVDATDGSILIASIENLRRIKLPRVFCDLSAN